ncbi:MAG TPA: DUF4129 domain-containing protein [Nitrososphaerales archaeon]|nr:DUF4129 domain-containing protein [Nitrososphaerales archaeon]HUK74866.1 DUF4129 domain-containing protein [Nitrososphaerales archaeon]
MVAFAVSSQLVTLAVLLALDALLYFTLASALLSRRGRRVNAKNLAEAFKALEAALKQAVPDLPDGFTWGEALERLRSAGVETDGMENALKGYERYRYGGRPLPDVDYHEVVMVANLLGGVGARKGGISILGQ